MQKHFTTGRPFAGRHSAVIYPQRHAAEVSQKEESGDASFSRDVTTTLLPLPPSPFLTSPSCPQPRRLSQTSMITYMETRRDDSGSLDLACGLYLAPPSPSSSLLVEKPRNLHASRSGASRGTSMWGQVLAPPYSPSPPKSNYLADTGGPFNTRSRASAFCNTQFMECLTRPQI
jgi:hypothetical protein